MSSGCGDGGRGGMGKPEKDEVVGLIAVGVADVDASAWTSTSFLSSEGRGFLRGLPEGIIPFNLRCQHSRIERAMQSNERNPVAMHAHSFRRLRRVADRRTEKKEFRVSRTDHDDQGQQSMQVLYCSTTKRSKQGINKRNGSGIDCPRTQSHTPILYLDTTLGTQLLSS